MFSKAPDQKLYENVVSQIKTAIETGRLKAGEMLPSEEVLSRSIGVSRATVREGLRVLSLLGMVETRRGKGTFVSADGAASFREKFEELRNNSGEHVAHASQVDMLLEPGVAGLAAETATKADLEKMKQVLQRMETALSHGETGEEESLLFHQCLVEAVRNPLLSAIFELTRDVHTRNRTLLSVLPQRPRQILKEHSKIYDAICRGDSRLAIRCMEDHIRKVREARERFFSLNDSPQACSTIIKESNDEHETTCPIR